MNMIKSIRKNYKRLERIPRTRHGYRLYQMYIYYYKRYWNKYLDAIQ